MERTLSRRAMLSHLGLLGAGVLLSASSAQGAPAKPGAKRPNIVFIMTDDHAAHALSCYGSKINQTPNLDRIAREGMRFENCFCTNALCAPSRAVILTGKYSHLNGLRDNVDKFDNTQQTFPKLLQKVGYQTALVGKWHLKTDPTGFDYWNILPGQGEYHDPVMIEMGEKKKREGYVTDLITDATIDFIEKRDPERPFCVMYHHKAPHRRWEPDEKHATMYADVEFPLPETFDDDYATRTSAAHNAEMRIDTHLEPQDVKLPIPEGLSPAELKRWKYQRYMEDYLRCVASVDDNVGRFLDYLDTAGLAENTVVMYTSDQGFFLGDHGWFDKRFMYEESLRMPLLVRFPGEVAPGSVAEAFVQNVDFGPTFLDFAGVAVPEDMQGRSIRPILNGKTPEDWRQSVYYQYFEFPAVHMVRRHYGIRTDRYKLIHFHSGPQEAPLDEWELYDLDTDPHELNNLYNAPDRAELIKELTAQLEQLRRDLKVPEA